MGRCGKYVPRFPGDWDQKAHYYSGTVTAFLLPVFLPGHCPRPALPAVRESPERSELFVPEHAKRLLRHSEFEPGKAGRLFFRAAGQAFAKTF